MITKYKNTEFRISYIPYVAFIPGFAESFSKKHIYTFLPGSLVYKYRQQVHNIDCSFILVILVQSHFPYIRSKIIIAQSRLLYFAEPRLISCVLKSPNCIKYYEKKNSIHFRLIINGFILSSQLFLGLPCIKALRLFSEKIKWYGPCPDFLQECLCSNIHPH